MLDTRKGRDDDYLAVVQAVQIGNHIVKVVPSDKGLCVQELERLAIKHSDQHTPVGVAIRVTTGLLAIKTDAVVETARAVTRDNARLKRHQRVDRRHRDRY